METLLAENGWKISATALHQPSGWSAHCSLSRAGLNLEYAPIGPDLYASEDTARSAAIAFARDRLADVERLTRYPLQYI